MKILRLSGICFGFLLLALNVSTPLYAAAIDPFYSKNQNPFVQIYGLPLAESGFITQPGEVRAVVVADVSNSYSDTALSSERVLIDGETTRVTALARYGLFDRLELGVDIPMISHGGGVTDGFIRNFHKLFGFPAAGRDRVANNQLNYLYAANSVGRVNINQSSTGLGDIQLSGAYQIWRVQNSRSLALRAGLKLPTGSAGKLHGSGGTDISLRLAYSDAEMLSSQNITVFGVLGGLVLGSGRVMQTVQRQYVSFASLGLGWQACKRVSVKVQLDAHTPFYNSKLDELGMTSVQVVMGGSISLFEETYLDLAVSEDAIVETAPDVVFHLALRTAF